jgi:GxxExxY protein
MLDGNTDLTDRILSCAIDVHSQLGPGLLESVYESALSIELRYRGIPFKRQVGFPLYYRGELISEHRPDLIVEETVIVEVKTVERFAPIHTAQMLTYLRVTSLQLGLLLNFNSETMKAGIRRVVLKA